MRTSVDLTGRAPPTRDAVGPAQEQEAAREQVNSVLSAAALSCW